MKGWVYVISNKAMPGLVKVGYSMRDPDLRADELNHTNCPHPYLVDYDVLVEHPREIEQKAHKILLARRENKEWFRCRAEEGIAAIKAAAGGRELIESYKRAEKQRLEPLHQEANAERDQEKRELAARQNLKAPFESENVRGRDRRIVAQEQPTGSGSQYGLRSGFDRVLDRDCPGWRAIANSQDFTNWIVCQPIAYQDMLLNTLNPRDAKEALDRFKVTEEERLNKWRALRDREIIDK
jgi:hypothetical protein